MVSYLLNCIFKLEQTICNMCCLIPEASNIQASKCLTYMMYIGVHVVTSLMVGDAQEYSYLPSSHLRCAFVIVLVMTSL